MAVVGTSLAVQWLRFHAVGPGLFPGQGTRSHMMQLRAWACPQLNILHAAAKI